MGSTRSGTAETSDDRPAHIQSTLTGRNACCAYFDDQAAGCFRPKVVDVQSACLSKQGEHGVATQQKEGECASLHRDHRTVSFARSGHAQVCGLSQGLLDIFILRAQQGADLITDWTFGQSSDDNDQGCRLVIRRRRYCVLREIGQSGRMLLCSSNQISRGAGTKQDVTSD